MIRNDTKIRICFIVVVGIFAIWYYTRTIDHSFVFDFIPDIFVSIISIVVFAFVFIKDRKYYRIDKDVFSFLPTCIGVLLSTCFFIILYIQYQKDISPNNFRCRSKMIDFNGVWLDFKTDNTYKLTNWTILGEYYYRGKYTIKDSIITLDKSFIDAIIVSNKLVIRKEMTINPNDTLSSVYQIDETGKQINGAEDFYLDKE